MPAGCRLDATLLAADVELAGWLLCVAAAVANRTVLDAYWQSLGRRLTGTRLVTPATGRPVGVVVLVRLGLHLVDAMTLGILGRVGSARGWHTLADNMLGTAVVVERRPRH